ncbi:MAG: AAA family ATPase [Phycisphaerae bacterium]|nr:AAA family ATPase [Phycisphaerae bacterium]
MADLSDHRSLADLDGAFRAGRPLIYLQSPEEQRAVRLITSAVQSMPGGSRPVFVWRTTDGLSRDGQRVDDQLTAPRAVLDWIIARDEPTVLVVCDLHDQIEHSPEIRRRLRDAYSACLDTGKFVIVCSPVRVVPEELSREIVFIKLTLPTQSELKELLDGEVERVRSTGGCVELDEASSLQLAQSMQGMTVNEARHALRRAVSIRGNRLDVGATGPILEEKRQLVRQSGLLEFVPETATIDQVGGAESLKKWLLQRKRLFIDRDSLDAEIVPKGILMMGVSGCGKSLSARTVANVFGLPLYRMEMVQVFRDGLDHAEGLFADACRLMEEIAPAVVWFDEIEMGISHHQQDASGTLDRIFAYFLTWMQEKPPGLFIAATANRIDLLPAEMIRKGRFDQIFFFDLPEAPERSEIFRIHLGKRGMDPLAIPLDLITERTEGWTGAEIEQCVIAAIVAARLADRPVTDRDLLGGLNEIVPLSKTMKEQVNYIRGWAFERAVRVTPRRR